MSKPSRVQRERRRRLRAAALAAKAPHEPAPPEVAEYFFAHMILGSFPCPCCSEELVITDMRYSDYVDPEDRSPFIVVSVAPAAESAQHERVRHGELVHLDDLEEPHDSHD